MEYVLSLQPGQVGQYPFGGHNPSAAIVGGGDLLFGVEEERFTREKHAINTFPTQSIKACLEYCDIGLRDVDRIVIPWKTGLLSKRLGTDVRRSIGGNDGIVRKLFETERTLERHVVAKTIATSIVRKAIATNVGEPVPEIKTREHHRCHAASAFYPSGFGEALVVTADGSGEYDSTVVWQADDSGLTRRKTYPLPNSLGIFYRIVTAFLGYDPWTRSEGKIMGLAPYGSFNEEIDSRLQSVVTTGLDYDVKGLTRHGVEKGVQNLETIFDRSRKDWAVDFTDWEQDLAFMFQRYLEETLLEIVEHYCRELGHDQVCLAGGVALNCKMNKKIRESDLVERVYIQPVSHDGGLTIGGAMLGSGETSFHEQRTAYFGPRYSTGDVEEFLTTNKIEYRTPEDLPAFVARCLADGDLVGWFQGRMEFGPRALGNRSILADPRTAESRDRVNEFVKHREPWRPFAPSMLAEAKDTYLVDAEDSPFMIMTFDTVEETRDEIEAVLHPGDATVRPQTVKREQNPRYHTLIDEFRQITGIPVVLNTSFNDSGEPIVNTPREAVRDFYSMGLDLLVLEDVVLEKGAT